MDGLFIQTWTLEPGNSLYWTAFPSTAFWIRWIESIHIFGFDFLVFVYSQFSQVQGQHLCKIFIIFINDIFSYSFESSYHQLLNLTSLPRIKAFTLLVFLFRGGTGFGRANDHVGCVIYLQAVLCCYLLLKLIWILQEILLTFVMKLLHEFLMSKFLNDVVLCFGSMMEQIIIFIF